MTINGECGIRKADWKKAAAIAAIILVICATGCQQKMADQPYHRPYTESKFFADGQSARPLEPGVIHRNQPLSDDPIVTWLTTQGKNVKADAEWIAQVDPTGKTTLPPGAPNDVANFVNEFPFEMHAADLKRGQQLYNANCALCHGGAGHANGKIPERGFLRPPSYHPSSDPAKKDWSTLAFNTQTNKPEPRYTENPQGSSRGFFRYGKTVLIKDVPVGYIFQVITWGYGGMAAHDTQIPDPADRWRVIAYIRALQFSQGAPVADVPDAAGKIGKKTETAPAAGGGHP